MAIFNEIEAAVKDGWLLVASFFAGWSILNALGLELEWDQFKLLAAAYDDFLFWIWSLIPFIELPSAAKRIMSIAVIYIAISIRAMIMEKSIFPHPETLQDTRLIHASFILIPFILFLFSPAADQIINDLFYDTNQRAEELKNNSNQISIALYIIICSAFIYCFYYSYGRPRAYISTLLSITIIISLDRLIPLINRFLSTQTLNWIEQ